MNNMYKNLALWLIMFLIMITLWNLFKVQPQPLHDRLSSGSDKNAITVDRCVVG